MEQDLTQLDDDLWVQPQPLRFLGLHLGTRMTVVRLASGGLFVHSPIALTDALRGQLGDLGPVRHVVAPNRYHHLYVGDFAKAYPEAQVHGAPRLAAKRKDVVFDSELGDTPHADWASDLEQRHIHGTTLRETVFFHRRTRTLISCDLTENFATSPHFATRLYLKLGGIHGRVGLSRPLRLFFRDKDAARSSIDQVLQWDFDRVTLAHGDVIETGGKEAIRQTYSWLR